MPGGSSCQLGLLQQHHILHAAFGQVVGHAGPHTPSPDDDSVRRVFPPLSQSRGGITGTKEGRRVTSEVENAPLRTEADKARACWRITPPFLCALSCRAADRPHGRPDWAPGRPIFAQMRAYQPQNPRHGRACDTSLPLQGSGAQIGGQKRELAAVSCPGTSTSSRRNFILFSQTGVNP